MRTNTRARAAQAKMMPLTHEGAPAAIISPIQQLRRSVLSCLLFEQEFYDGVRLPFLEKQFALDGTEATQTIRETVPLVPPSVVAALAIEARSHFHLRHVPLYLAALLCQQGCRSALVSETIAAVIQRADELSEFLAIYAKVNGVTPDKLKPKLSNQVRKGLALAFPRFGAYALAKYDRDGAVRLRDALFLCHARPKDEDQNALWHQLVSNDLPTPDTWEVALSCGADKRETFTRLISEGQLGYLALLRNLRNCVQAGVDPNLVMSAIVARKGARRVLPFRYVAAARAAPMFEPALDQALTATINETPALPGRTVVLVDVSGSMDQPLSEKSDLKRIDAAATLAAMLNAESLRVFTFSDALVEVPPRRGMAGVDAIMRSQPLLGTKLVQAVQEINAKIPHDRLIVITDEQAAAAAPKWSPMGLLAQRHWQEMYGAGRLEDPVCPHGYMINVASARNGIGYGAWCHLDGFSEHILHWITEHEAGWDARPAEPVEGPIG